MKSERVLRRAWTCTSCDVITFHAGENPLQSMPKGWIAGPEIHTKKLGIFPLAKSKKNVTFPTIDTVFVCIHFVHCWTQIVLSQRDGKPLDQEINYFSSICDPCIRVLPIFMLCCNSLRADVSYFLASRGTSARRLCGEMTYNGTPPYDHLVNTTTSLIRPLSFVPN